MIRGIRPIKNREKGVPWSDKLESMHQGSELTEPLAVFPDNVAITRAVVDERHQ
jgi:hypothetical protein